MSLCVLRVAVVGNCQSGLFLVWSGKPGRVGRSADLNRSAVANLSPGHWGSSDFSFSLPRTGRTIAAVADDDVVCVLVMYACRLSLLAKPGNQPRSPPGRRREKLKESE